jgi:hypothetical protein
MTQHEEMQTAAKSYTVRWRVRDRVSKGDYCHESQFVNADYRVRDLDAEAVLDAWYAANCDVDDDRIVLDYLIFAADGSIVGDGSYSYAAQHEDDEEGEN